MRLTLPLAAALMAAAAPALAQTTIIERDEPAVVVRDRPAAVIERREVEVPPRVGGCERTTVTRENDDGDRETVQKERCD
ncbi:hypothetical protein MMB17_02275 [Methylobacterium organophilum]|uniref:hypothetical protein n=1 Tax=Methylobacterium organophilum TaxID=410 RepID=UPI001F13C514|nr:hypothetical protein [Methylobacterium organophilum]UMY18201.1 hypothetical protein MMB17_02275 [Methylobacterium organophilum]